jgi:hypothetical protein
MRRLLILLVAVLATTAVGAAAPAAAARTPYCGIRWGSLAKAHESTAVAPLVNVRAGRRTCYDRLVVDFSGRVNGYRVGAGGRRPGQAVR